MRLPEDQLPPRSGNGSRFATTHWSLVLAAGGTSSREVRPAMSRLLETYWYPLYAFIRRKGSDPEEACDLTQEFLVRLLERNLGDSRATLNGSWNPRQ